MIPIDRDDIHIISRHSNWSEPAIRRTLTENVYSSAEAWKKFLKSFFLTLGVCMTTLGIIFFFAYNWDDLGKFTKIGLIEALIVIATAATLLLRINLLFRNIILTGAAMLVGVLFAVFGQIYQTGANAYDFFLAWTACIALWTAVSNFPPLWLIFIALVNTTFILFVIQVAVEWRGISVFTVLFVINGVYLTILLLFSKWLDGVNVPAWFRNTTALATVFCSTIAVCIGIMDFGDYQYSQLSRGNGVFIVASLLSLAAYAGAIYYSLKTKSGFFISLVLFSIVIIISTLLLKSSGASAMYLFTSMFIIGSVTGIIALLIYLQKTWSNG